MPTLSSLALAATYDCVVDDASIGLFRARLVPSTGGGSSGSSPVPYTSSSESWAAFQPVLALTWTRTYRTVVSAKVMFTVLAPVGLKALAEEAASVANDVPLVLPRTLRVSLRASQAVGSFRDASLMGTLLPRSTWTHCGNAPEGPSQ